MTDVELLRVWLYGGGCAGVAVLMFCRAVHMTRATASLAIRLAVSAGGWAAVWALWSLHDGHVPAWPDIGLVWAWLGLLVVASRVWAGGLPAEYTRPGHLDA